MRRSGGFGDGIWTPSGNKWIVKASATLKDGKKMVATNVITRVDADTMTFQSQERTLNGTAIPDTKLLTMKRAK